VSVNNMGDNANPDIYRPMDVPKSISPFVRRVLAADSKDQIDIRADVRSTGYHYLGWVWSGRWAGMANNNVRFNSDKDGSIHLSGQVKNSKATAIMQGKLGHIILEFTALGHYQLLGITGERMLDDVVIPQVVNPELNNNFEVLISTQDLSPHARLALLAHVLSQLPENQVPESIVAAINSIESADGNIRLADIISDIGLAERKFRTDFKKFVGVTPKIFCRTLQINHALNELINLDGCDLASVALRTGFSDQAHFTRAFSDFLGKAPAGYMESIETTLARFMGQSRSR